MSLPLAFAALLLPALAAAQSLPIPTSALPTCIITCLTSSALSAGCAGFTDVSCVCPGQAFQTAALACLTSQCSVTDQTIAITVQEAVCAGYSGALSILTAGETALTSLSSVSTASTQSVASVSSISATSTESTASAASVQSVSSTSAAYASSTSAAAASAAALAATHGLSRGAKIGAIVGGVLGGLLLLLLLALLLWCCCRRRSRQRVEPNERNDIDWDSSFDPYRYQAVKPSPDRTDSGAGTGSGSGSGSGPHPGIRGSVTTDATIAAATWPQSRGRPPSSIGARTRPLPSPPLMRSNPTPQAPLMRVRTSSSSNNPHVVSYATTPFSLPPNQHTRRNTGHSSIRPLSVSDPDAEADLEPPTSPSSLSPSELTQSPMAPSALAMLGPVRPTRQPTWYTHSKAREAGHAQPGFPYSLGPPVGAAPAQPMRQPSWLAKAREASSSSSQPQPQPRPQRQESAMSAQTYHTAPLSRSSSVMQHLDGGPAPHESEPGRDEEGESEGEGRQEEAEEEIPPRYDMIPEPGRGTGKRR